MSVESVKQNQARTTDAIEMPAPTAWPIVLALGIALLFGGLVTNAAVGILGGILAAAAAVGWFRDVLPFEAHEMVTVTAKVPAVTTSRHEVIPIAAARELRRAFLPLEIYPVSAGVKGGLAGSVAMAVTAMLYGALSRNGIWYPVNLLAAGFLPSTMTDTVAKLSAFNSNTLLIAATIHLITSLLVGLLYGAMLPMLPRRPALLGGLVAPLMWTGLIHSTLGIVNPVLNHCIDWFWFVASQVAFGVVAGIVVARQERIRTWQRLPLSVRSGMEATGMRDDNT
jgi:hypothetical protein